VEDLRNRVAFVTGGASGIGLAIARAFLQEGMRVALADRDVPELDRQVTGLGDAALAVPLDVTDRGAWVAAKGTVERAFGPVDVLVNNAGIGPDGRPLADMAPGSFDRLVGIKLTGTFNGVHTFAGGMRDRGSGWIVNTASMAGLTASARLGAYTAAMFGVVGMSEVLAAELAPHGVGVSVLCPGLVETRLRATTLAAGNDVIDGPAGAARRGIPASVVGDLVVAGIRAGRLHIVTHGEYRSRVAERMATIVAAFDDVPHRSQDGRPEQRVPEPPTAPAG